MKRAMIWVVILMAALFTVGCGAPAKVFGPSEAQIAQSPFIRRIFPEGKTYGRSVVYKDNICTSAKTVQLKPDGTVEIRFEMNAGRQQYRIFKTDYLGNLQTDTFKEGNDPEQFADSSDPLWDISEKEFAGMLRIIEDTKDQFQWQ